MTGSEGQLSERHGYEHLTNWLVVVAESDEEGEFAGEWRSVVKLTADEEVPTGETYMREVAWFAPTDYALELAKQIAGALNA